MNSMDEFKEAWDQVKTPVRKINTIHGSPIFADRYYLMYGSTLEFHNHDSGERTGLYCIGIRGTLSEITSVEAEPQ